MAKCPLTQVNQGNITKNTRIPAIFTSLPVIEMVSIVVYSPLGDIITMDTLAFLQLQLPDAAKIVHIEEKRDSYYLVIEYGGVNTGHLLPKLDVRGDDVSQANIGEILKKIRLARKERRVLPKRDIIKASADDYVQYELSEELVSNKSRRKQLVEFFQVDAPENLHLRRYSEGIDWVEVEFEYKDSARKGKSVVKIKKPWTPGMEEEVANEVFETALSNVEFERSSSSNN